MSRNLSRQEIIDCLLKSGPVDDATGKATAKLRETLAYKGSEQGFTQLIASMERSGELTRVVKGKRTYRIAANADSITGLEERSAVVGPASEGPAMDYDELASALLVRVVRAIAVGNDDRLEEGSWARRRIDRLERRIGELERDLLRARAESKSLMDERDNLKMQLEHSDGNLAVLTERLAGQRPQRNQVANRLGNDERMLLHQLRSGGSRDRPHRVG
jgi:hypothetical protein